MSNPRTLNVNRMRRYIARTTPDVAHRTFDANRWDYDHDYHEWLNAFARRMGKKHPGSNLHLTATPADPLNPDVYVVEARVRTEETP